MFPHWKVRVFLGSTGAAAGTSLSAVLAPEAVGQVAGEAAESESQPEAATHLGCFSGT